MKKASLNHIFRLVWSAVNNAWVAVAEIAKGHSAGTVAKQDDVKASESTDLNTTTVAKLSKKAHLNVMVAFALASVSSMALALPAGGDVISGTTTFSPNGTTLNINQVSDKSIVQWTSFNIANTESVRLTQPANGMALYRVVGNEASQIFGQLSATGKLFLINPNGILFGQGSTVDVGSLVASTLNITNADFESNNFAFAANGGNSAGVINRGSIKAADDGYIVMLSNSVENAGSIVAKRVSVVMASAEAAKLDFFGNGLVKASLSGNAVNALVNNAGSISANGGLVQLAANARTAAINVSGIVEANNLVERNGMIRLEGDLNASVTVDGSLLAQAGDVSISGKDVILMANTLLNNAAPAAGNPTISSANLVIDANSINATGMINVTNLTTVNFSSKQRNDVIFSNVNNDFNKVVINNLDNKSADVTIEDKNGLTISGTVNTIFARTDGGNMVLGGDLIAEVQGNENSNTIDSQTKVATPITLVTSDYFSDGGFGFKVLSGTKNNRWLVFASDVNPVSPPYGDNVLGPNLPVGAVDTVNGYDFYDFVQYGKAFNDGKLITSPNDGFIYSAPGLKLVGTVTKVYDGTLLTDNAEKVDFGIATTATGTTFNLINTPNITNLLYTSKNVGKDINMTATVSNISFSIDNGAFDINARPVTFFDTTALNQSITVSGIIGIIDPKIINLSGTKVYDGNNSFLASTFGQFSGVTVNGVTEKLAVSGTATVNSPNVTTNPQMLNTPLNLTLVNGSMVGEGESIGMASNYTLVGGTHTGIVTPKVISLMGSKIYDGDANFASSVFGPISGVTVNGVTERLSVSGTGNATVGSPNVTPMAQTLTLPTSFMLANGTVAGTDTSVGMATNYTLVGGAHTGIVTPKPLTINANPIQKTFGQIDPVLTFTTVGLVSGSEPTGSLLREEGEAVRSQGYSIMQGTLTYGLNYSETFNGNTFTILAALPPVVVNPPVEPPVVVNPPVEPPVVVNPPVQPPVPPLVTTDPDQPINLVGLIRESGRNPDLNPLNIVPLNTAAGDEDDQQVAEQCPADNDRIRGMQLINSGMRMPAGVVVNCI